MANLKVAITGSSGLVGSRILELLPDFDFILLRYENGFDITNQEIVWDNLKELEYDILLHLAAYTLVDKAEEENELAYRINVDGTKNVFEAAQQRGKKFVYISTDYVFNGITPDVFFDEDSRPDPVGVYGKSKYEGEKVVADQAMIVRLSYPYRADFEKFDFVRKIRSLLEEGRHLKMIVDSIITPTFIDDIAFGLKHLINNYSPEVFHLVGGNFLSPYDCGLLIAKEFGLPESLISKTDFASYFGEYAETRPQYTPTKSKKNNFHRMSAFQEGLEKLKKSQV